MKAETYQTRNGSNAKASQCLFQLSFQPTAVLRGRSSLLYIGTSIQAVSSQVVSPGYMYRQENLLSRLYMHTCVCVSCAYVYACSNNNARKDHEFWRGTLELKEGSEGVI